MGNNIELIIKALGFSPELLQNQIPAITSLLNDLNENIITSDDVSEQLEHMTKREKILNRQKSFCGIWLASDGRYKTKVPTADGGKHPMPTPIIYNPDGNDILNIPRLLIFLLKN